MTQQNVIIALPTFAPLPVPMVLHIIGESYNSFISHLHQDLEKTKKQLFELQERVTITRSYVYSKIKETLQQKSSLQQKWFQEQIASQLLLKPLKRGAAEGKEHREYSMSNRTWSNWRQSGILLPNEPRKLNFDRAAALFIVAIVDERKQGFVPEIIEHSEPEYWGYMQTTPEAPVLPCPWPPPATLPASTLFWSSWPSFSPSLKQLPNGSIGFPFLSQASLFQWNPALQNIDVRTLLDNSFFGFGQLKSDALRDLAEPLYYRLASTRLSLLPSIPTSNLSFLWPDTTWS